MPPGFGWPSIIGGLLAKGASHLTAIRSWDLAHVQSDDQAPDDQRDDRGGHHGQDGARFFFRAESRRARRVFVIADHFPGNLDGPICRAGQGAAEFFLTIVTSISAARVTLECTGRAVTNLAHDLHGPVAIGAKGDFGAGQNRNDPHGPLAPGAFGRGSQNVSNYRRRGPGVHARGPAAGRLTPPRARAREAKRAPIGPARHLLLARTERRSESDRASRPRSPASWR